SALTALVLATVLFFAAGDAAANQYTVWATSIFHRTGERTPEVLGYIPTTLTSYGAQQVHNSGTFFRQRHVSSASTNPVNSAPIQGLSSNRVDNLQVFVGALDEQWTVASAQAFLQGLYPPYTLNASTASLLDPTSILANGTYVENPLSGYQYGQVHSFGGYDPEFPYLGGSLDCPAFDIAAVEYANTPQFAAVEAESRHIYQAIGQPLLRSVLNPSAWDYFNAYAIYDYLNYQRSHNATVAALLSQPQYINATTKVSYFDQLRWYADHQQWAQLTNLTAQNNYTGKSEALPGRIKGSISTIAGNLLAAKMLAQLQVAIQTSGSYYKFSALFGDFEPMVSLFALLGLPNINSNFYGIPDFGSVAVFELFSYTNNSMSMLFPSTSDLWVRFYFRNGSGGTNETSGNYQSYPIFNRGPSQTDMTWHDFQTGMYGILLADIGSWCTQCGATNLFCAAWNSSDATTNTTDSTTFTTQRQMKPAIAGVIGAVVTLVVAGLVFALAMLVGGVRFHRTERRSRSELGGFKGSQKLASDRDLTNVPKGGATVGASIERSPDSPLSPIGHERVGSWELK
ncbi:hypothetical protein BAUCODRAFT_46040, partial [Baudoinia panamericana UAMH 10762]